MLLKGVDFFFSLQCTSYDSNGKRLLVRVGGEGSANDFLLEGCKIFFERVASTEYVFVALTYGCQITGSFVLVCNKIY